MNVLTGINFILFFVKETLFIVNKNFQQSMLLICRHDRIVFCLFILVQQERLKLMFLMTSHTSAMSTSSGFLKLDCSLRVA